MKTSGTTEVLPLSKKQKVLCNVVMGVLLIAAGIILVLAGTDVIHAAAGKIAAPTVLFAIGIAILFSAVIAKNALSMWISGVIISCGLVSLIEITTVATYAQLYPIYIAAPGIGCIFSVWFAEAKFPQIKGMAFFIVLAGVFAFASSGAAGWGTVGGMLALFVGICVSLYSIGIYLGRKKDNA